MERNGNVLVIDPSGAARDAKMPSLTPALDPVDAGRRLKRHLARLAGEHGLARLQTIRVTRHKPGRRCLVEYDVEVERPGAPPEIITLIGKVRAGRYGKSGYQLLDLFWSAGFGPDSDDGIHVAEPIGVVGKFRMWLQRKVPGRVATDLLAARGGVALARRIAEAANKVHQADVPTQRRHTMADELRILHECLLMVAQAERRWAGRIERLLEACDRIGAATSEPVPRGIHRDFYSDQVIVNGSEICIIDFDLYCHGDPALDIGNFLGHITEQSLRTRGDPDALADLERAMEERFVELSGEAVRAAVRAYAALTLARHIYISMRLPERRPFAGSLLELCEERLGVVACNRI